MIPFSSVPWGLVGYWALIVLGIVAGAATAIFLGWALVKFVFIPFFKWLSCIKLPHCGLCENMKAFFGWFAIGFKYRAYIFLPFWWLILGIGKVGVIIGHMIYSTYKKQCPIIEWKE